MRVRSLWLTMILLAALPLGAAEPSRAPDTTGSGLPSAITPGNSRGTGAQYYVTDMAGVDSVNLVNGRPEIHIPLAALKGRAGLDVALHANYSANGLWSAEPDPFDPDYTVLSRPRHEYEAGGWKVQLTTDWILEQQYFRVTFNFGSTSPYSPPVPGVLLRYVVHSPDGSTHELRNKGVEDYVRLSTRATPYPAPSKDLPLPRVYRSLDSSAMELDHTVYDAPVLKLKNGTRVEFDFKYFPWNDDFQKSPDTVIPGGLGFARELTDPNGNRVTTSGPVPVRDANGILTGYTETITDTLGRPIVKEWSITGGHRRHLPETVTFPGNRVYRIDLQGYRCYPSRVELDINPNPRVVGPERWGSFTGVSSITLPNGKAFKFDYRDFTNPTDPVPVSDGLVTTVTYPGGGQTEYQYQPTYGTWSLGMGIDVHYYRVRSRTVRPKGAGGPQHTWTYRPSTTHLELKVDVTDPDSNLEIHKFHAPASFLQGMEFHVENRSASGAVLKVVRREYEYDQASTLAWARGYNERVKKETVTIDGATFTREYDYDRFGMTTGSGATQFVHSFVNVLETRETDFDGALLRRTVNTYARSPYMSPQYHILDKVASTSVYDGAGTRVSYTTHGYDDYSADAQGHDALVNRAGIVQHDPAYGATFTVRGNLTSVVRYRDAAGGTSALIEGYRYDIAGNVTRSQDPKGNATQFDYTDAFDVGNRNTFAFVTEITNALGHVESRTYFFNHGMTRSETNGAGHTTTYQYVDPLFRLTHRDPPLDAPTVTTYDDTPGQVKVETRTGAHVLVTRMDGLGRPWRTEEDRDGQGAVFVDTVFDHDGRIESVSNPGRGAPAPEKTVHVYDALGREIELQRPGGDVTTRYGARTRTLTDEVGDPTTFTLNSLDQVVRVVDGRGVTADYDYDAGGNLIRAQVGSQVREFFYDGLSQLRAYVLPEIPVSGGSPSYGGRQVSVRMDYDPAGNLAAKQFAAGPAAGSSSASILYLHDALHRLTRVDYAGGTVDAPTEHLVYDTVQKGLLTSKDNGHSQTFIDQYDQEGRPLIVRQKVFGMEAETEYAYDGLGNVRSMKYPSGRQVTLTHSVRRATALSIGRGIVTGVTHWPHGGQKQVTLGNGLVFNQTFNGRLQPSTQQVSGPAGLLMNLRYGFTTSSGANNGSLRTLEDLKEGSTLTLGYNRRDELVSASKTGGPLAWSQTFSPDGYGNLVIQGAGVSPVLAYSAATNRISSAGFEYDAAGNLVTDPDAKQKYVYNTAGHLVEVKDLAGATKAKFWHDSDGRRIAKDDDAGLRTVYYLESQSGRVLSEYEGAPTAAAAPAGSAGRVVYLHGDTLKSVRLTTDEQGKEIYRTDYLPFGEEIADRGERGPQRKFAGKHREEGLLLDYSEARWYAFRHGRFTTIDPELSSGKPESLASWNRYAYGLNNPYKYADPDGREPVTITAALIYVGKAAIGAARDTALDYAVAKTTGGKFTAGDAAKSFAVNLGMNLIPGLGEAKGIAKAAKLAKVADEATQAAGAFAKQGDNFVSVTARSFADQGQKMPSGPLTTVLGSGKNVGPFKGKEGYNVLHLNTWTWRQNQIFLDEAIKRGDRIVMLPGKKWTKKEAEYLTYRGWIREGDEWVRGSR